MLMRRLTNVYEFQDRFFIRPNYRRSSRDIYCRRTDAAPQTWRL